jgi:hypothetical protein
MPRLFEYVLAVRKMTREEFVDAHPHPFLLRRREEERSREGWTFKTQTVSVAQSGLGRLAANEKLRISPEIANFDVYPVAKALDNPWPERVSVGRARNNDVVLADSSVSKLHAHFKVGDGTDGYALVDAGSRNGTCINDDRIEAGAPIAVQVGDSITFGRTRVTFIDGDTLYTLVSRHVEETE